MKLDEVLQRLDRWLGKREWLAAPANTKGIAKAEKALGVPLPSSLRALYERHDGETEASPVFDAACRDDYEIVWEATNPGEMEIRFMSLAEVARAGAHAFVYDEDGALLTEVDAPDGEKTQLVPFVWIRNKQSEHEALAPDECDMFVAVDTSREAVWLFENGGQGLEERVKEADDLAAWLDTRVKRLERNEDLAEGAAQAPSKARAERSSAELLLRFLLDRDLAHLAPGASLARIAERLAPLLAIKPEKRAIATVIEFLESDDAIDEVFAEDDVLRAIIVEFLD